MQLIQAIKLIEKAPVSQEPQTWSDLGCGEGLFTEALANHLQAGSIIYAIDKKENFRSKAISGIEINFIRADFIADELPVRQLHGIMMANAFHYVKDKTGVLRKLETYFQNTPRFLFVEYDTDQPVPVWVPYPISYKSLTQFFHSNGYNTIERLAEHPSVYGRANMYSAWVTK